MDLVIVIVLIILVLVWKQSFKDLVFALAIIELFFRLTHYISELIKVKEVTNIVSYIPSSLSSLITTYSEGIFSTVLEVGLLACALAFEYYLIKGWIKKK